MNDRSCLSEDIEYDIMDRAKAFLSLLRIVEEKTSRYRIVDYVKDLLIDTSTFPRKPKGKEAEEGVGSASE